MASTLKGDRLNPGDKLQPGEALLSPNKWYLLVLQAHDGNLVLYHLPTNDGSQLADTSQPRWATGTHKWPGDAAFTRDVEMQASDGHLVAYSQQGRSTWASGVFGGDKAGAYARLQDDGNFVVYDQQGHPLWATKTDGTHRFWMQENIDPSHTLKQVCLPASHDAGMYEISGTKGRWSRGLAQTQERSIYDQLLAGCRR